MRTKPRGPRRHALLVPISHYDRRSGFGELLGVVADAERLRAVLEDPDLCETHSLKVLPAGLATRTTIFNEVRRLARRADQSDQVILYFGGHAYRAMDETKTRWNYWFVPFDATLENIESVGISADDLAGLLAGFKARDVVVILDICHASGVTGFPWPGQLLERLADSKANHFIMAATLEDEVAADTGRGGLFVQALCEALEGKHVVPGPAGRISIQLAWCHAAASVEEDAESGPDRQHSSVANIGRQIYVTQVPPPRRLPVVGIYPRSEHTEVFDLIRTLIAKSKTILMVGTGLSVTWEERIPKLLLERAQDPGVRIDIGLANPRNPSVRSRLVEERMWDEDPPLDATGIERRVRRLVEGNQHSAGRMRVRLFEHYPTMATLIFDNEIFLYPYGFHVLGTNSPITHIHDDGSDEARFYRTNAQTIFDTAIPAESALAAWSNRRYVDPEWVAAAVYLIPGPKHRLYRFGSGILGYDIHARRSRRPPVRSPAAGAHRHAGSAGQYGFHVTLADALYFRPETLDRVAAEIRMLATEYKPFPLGGFHLACPFHGDPQTLALRCNDPSGTAEALHHELVSRFYGLALSSTYRVGQAKDPPAKRSRRQKNLIDRFGAPYILSEFDPHFTLSTGLPADESERQAIVQKVREAFDEAGPIPYFRAEELCLVVRMPGDPLWKIDSTWALGG